MLCAPAPAISRVFPAVSFNPATPSLRAVGEITLRFSSPSTAELEFTIDGLRYRRATERTRF